MLIAAQRMKCESSRRRRREDPTCNRGDTQDRDRHHEDKQRVTGNEACRVREEAPQVLKGEAGREWRQSRGKWNHLADNIGGSRDYLHWVMRQVETALGWKRAREVAQQHVPRSQRRSGDPNESPIAVSSKATWQAPGRLRATRSCQDTDCPLVSAHTWNHVAVCSGTEYQGLDHDQVWVQPTSRIGKFRHRCTERKGSMPEHLAGRSRTDRARGAEREK